MPYVDEESQKHFSIQWYSCLPWLRSATKDGDHLRITLGSFSALFLLSEFDLRSMS
jgi:hypothetical protein